MAERLTRRALDELGGMGRFVGRGDVVWVKPNIGWNRAPELGATTNPGVVAALRRELTVQNRNDHVVNGLTLTLPRPVKEALLYQQPYPDFVLDQVRLPALGPGQRVQLQLSLSNWAIIVWLAVVNTAFAFTLWNRTLRTLTAMESSIINNTMLFQIAVLAWAFLGEDLDWWKVSGMVLAAAGTLVVQLRPSLTKL